MKPRLASIVLLSMLMPALAVEAQVRSPQDFLGFRVGDDYKLADWQQITTYFSDLDKASDRVKTEVVGTTTRKHPSLVVTIAPPETQQKIDGYMETTRRLSDPRGLAPEEAERVIGEGKSVIAITCSFPATEVSRKTTRLNATHSH